MADTERLLAPPARLRLPAHEPTPARAEVVYRPRSVRLTRALLSLAGFWALVPIVFFLPPHLPWALAAFALGIYFAWANWTGSYEVRTLQGACPRCGNALAVKPGAKISLPHKITCYNCHHEPHLEMAQVPE
jgi:hypothetical protein